MGRESIPPPSVLDVKGTLARFGGDEVLFAELAGFLLSDLPPLYQELRGAVTEGDAAEVRQHAHALKGLVAGCGGIRAAQVAQAVENAGQAGKITHAASLLDSLENELEQLTQALRAYSSSSEGRTDGDHTSQGSPST
jgi:HPt (histidine-containing phosphotransfer) domain-containing protein